MSALGRQLRCLTQCGVSRVRRSQGKSEHRRLPQGKDGLLINSAEIKHSRCEREDETGSLPHAVHKKKPRIKQIKDLGKGERSD